MGHSVYSLSDHSIMMLHRCHQHSREMNEKKGCSGMYYNQISQLSGSEVVENEQEGRSCAVAFVPMASHGRIDGGGRRGKGGG